MLDSILNLDWRVQIALLVAVVVIVWLLRETISKILKDKFSSKDMKEYAEYHEKTKDIAGDSNATLNNWKSANAIKEQFKK